MKGSTRFAAVTALAAVGALIAGCGGGSSSPSTTSETIPTVTSPTTTATVGTTSTGTPTTTTTATTTGTSSKPVAGPKGSKPFASPDGLMLLNVDPSWPLAAEEDGPEGGALWLVNLSPSGQPTEQTANILLVAEPLKGTTLEEDVTSSLKELHMTPRSKKAITLADGSPAIRIDATQTGSRLVAIIALDAAGKNTISATYQAADIPGFEARLKVMEPYLRTLRKP